MISSPKLKSLALTLTLCIATWGAGAQSRITRQEYVDRYKHIAVAHMERYGIPASITMAQGILESDSGNSQLSTRSNNHFGIKCKSNWTGGKVYHDDDAKDECFRAYGSVEESYGDHAEFLDNSPRYDALFDLASSDYKGWAKGLKKAGYATAPDYAERLIKIIEDSDLHLLDQKNGIAKYADLHGGHASTEGWFEGGENGVTSISGEGIDPNNYSATINAHKGYNVYRNNRVFYVVSKGGDTYEQIAEFFDLSERRLRSYNDLSRKATITRGEIIYIAKKESKWRGKGRKTHTVKSGETLRSISQEYGIGLKSICRINNLKDKNSLKVGQTIKLK